MKRYTITLLLIGFPLALSASAQQVPTLNKCRDTLPISAAVTENELRDDNHPDLLLTRFANTSLQCSTVYSDALIAEYGPIAPVLFVRASHLLLSKVLSNLTGFLSEQGRLGDFHQEELNGGYTNSLPYSTEPLSYRDCKTSADVLFMRIQLEPDKAKADTNGLTTTQIQFRNERNKECLNLLMKDKETLESRNKVLGLETYGIWLTEAGIQNVLQFIGNDPKLKDVYETEERR